ncbi:hypothetical protein Ctob_000860, partial [Chrysochromulina tobinii]
MPDFVRSSSSSTLLAAAVDEHISSGLHVNLLGRTQAAASLLSTLQDCETDPVLDKAASASLIAVTPSDGLTSAQTRVSGVMRSVTPLKAHLLESFFTLVAPSASDAPRSALMISLLLPALLGRGSLEREDGGLAAWKAVHMLLANELAGSAARGFGHADTPFTRVITLPSASLAGVEIGLAEALVEGLQIRRDSHESVASCLEKRRMPLAGDLLVVYSEAADIPSNGSTLPWEDAMRNTSAFRSGAPLGSPSRFRIGGGEAAGAPSPPEHQLRVGDAIIGVTGKLLSPALAKYVLGEARRPLDSRGSSESAALSLIVLRTMPAEDARSMAAEALPGRPPLNERAPAPAPMGAVLSAVPAAAAGGPSGLRAAIQTSSQPARPTGFDAAREEAPITAPNTATATGFSAGAQPSSARQWLGGSSTPTLLGAVAAASGLVIPRSMVTQTGAARAKLGSTLAGMTKSGMAEESTMRHAAAHASTLEELRHNLVEEALDRARVEGESMLQRHEEVAAARAAAMLDHAEIEAEAVRLMKRSHTQASAEAEIRAQLEWERQQELKELKERHEAEVTRLKLEHQAALDAGAAALEDALAAALHARPMDDAQLAVLAAAMQQLGGGADALRHSASGAELPNLASRESDAFEQAGRQRTGRAHSATAELRKRRPWTELLTIRAPTTSANQPVTSAGAPTVPTPSDAMPCATSSSAASAIGLRR